MTAEGVVEGGKGDKKQDKSREIDTQKYTEEGGCIGCGKGGQGEEKRDQKRETDKTKNKAENGGERGVQRAK